MTNYLLEYHDLIKRGEVVVGYWIRKEIENLVKDLEDERFYYDTKEAHKRIKFAETLCTQSKAPYYGKPFVFMPWQKCYIEVLYSFKMKDTNTRRFVESLLEVARKNGKTSLMAADGAYDLFLGVGGSSICCASNDDRQCRLIFDEIAGIRQRLDTKNEVTKKNLTKLYNFIKNIEFFRLSSKTQNKDGFNMSKTYLDESHDINEENGQSEIAEASWRGMSSQDEPLFLNCTTNGFNRDCYLDKKIAKAKAVINGEIDDIHFLPFLYEQDSEEEIWQDEASWEKSNPSIRYGVKKINKLRRDIEDAKRDTATRIHLLCKDFNIPQNTATAWLRLEDYDYVQEVKTLEDFRGCVCLAGVDLSETTDLTNCKLLFKKPNDNTKYIFSHYWIPESKLTKSDDKESGAKYKEWAKDGHITICEGNDNDLTLVADWLMELKNKYNIRAFKVFYDVKFARDFINRLEFHGIASEVIPQNAQTLSNAMRLVESDLKSRVINYGNNPVDKWCFSNSAIEVNNKNQCLCVKIGNKASNRIDGAVTTIILFEGFRRSRSEFLKYVR